MAQLSTLAELVDARERSSQADLADWCAILYRDPAVPRYLWPKMPPGDHDPNAWTGEYRKLP